MRHDTSSQGQLAGRAVQVFLVAVIGMAFVGLIVGLRQGATIYEPAEIDRVAGVPSEHAVPATAYADFDRRRFGPNAQWRSELSDLVQPEVDFLEPIEWDEEARAILRSLRLHRRGFEGAPPTVPHPIDQMTSASCLSCHASGKVIGNTFAPPMSHQLLHNCTQCHVEQNSSEWKPGTGVPNLFEPHDGPLAGERAWPGAPPTIPHPVDMRQDCMSCHGPRGPDPIRTSHPWRANCMQCHAPSGDRSGPPNFGLSSGFLPPPDVEQTCPANPPHQ